MNRFEAGLNLYASLQAAAALGFCMMQDFRSHMVSVKKIALFLLASIILYGRWNTKMVDSLIGIAAGVFFILLSRLTRERIGMADALLITCIGWSLGAADLFSILFLAFAGAAVYGAFLLLQKKNRNTEFAFLPFLFFAYLFVLIFHVFHGTTYAGLFFGGGTG